LAGGRNEAGDLGKAHFIRRERGEIGFMTHSTSTSSM
jgi:hypothetical protein